MVLITNYLYYRNRAILIVNFKLEFEIIIYRDYDFVFTYHRELQQIHLQELLKLIKELLALGHLVFFVQEAKIDLIAIKEITSNLFHPLLVLNLNPQLTSTKLNFKALLVKVIIKRFKPHFKILNFLIFEFPVPKILQLTILQTFVFKPKLEHQANPLF